jgi:Protein of unknown function (DUF1186)/SEC-C motif
LVNITYNIKLSAEQIVAKLNTVGFDFPRKELNEALLQQEAITPLLLVVIKNVAEDPETINDVPVFLYALFILAQFREKKAYPFIVQYFRQLGSDVTALDPTGDIVTENLNSILASVCNGDLELIKQLIENQRVNIFVRNAALRSLVILYSNDQLSRKALVSYIKAHIERCLEKQDAPCFIASLVSVSCDIHPEELYNQMVICFDLGLVDKQMINERDFERYMAMDKEKVLSELKGNRQCQLISDVISEMQGWACYHLKSDTKNLLATEFENIINAKVGRNDPCPCGSAKKYKKCCLH